MIPEAAQTLLLSVLTVVPGGVYTWAFEQQAGRYGANFGDRVQRFLAVSVLLVNGWIRIQLSDGRWVCGLWGVSTTTGLTSYASGYPEDKDLLVAEVAEVDKNGEFITENGVPVLTGRAALVTWETTIYSEFIPG